MVNVRVQDSNSEVRVSMSDYNMIYRIDYINENGMRDCYLAYGSDPEYLTCRLREQHELIRVVHLDTDGWTDADIERIRRIDMSKKV